MKICKTCGIEKELTEFNSNGYSRYGAKSYKPNCRYCDRLIKKNKYRDEIIIIRGEFVKIPTEYKKKVTKQRREWDEKNRERKNQLNRDWYRNLPLEEKKKRNKIMNIKAKKKRMELIINKIKNIRGNN